MTIFPPRETIGLAPAPLITEMPSPKKTGKLAPVAPRIKKIEYFTEQRQESPLITDRFNALEQVKRLSNSSF